jgi:hypothetical protein
VHALLVALALGGGQFTKVQPRSCSICPCVTRQRVQTFSSKNRAGGAAELREEGIRGRGRHGAAPWPQVARPHDN